MESTKTSKIIKTFKRSKRCGNGRQFLLNYFPFHMLGPRKGPFLNYMNIPLYFAYGSNMSKERLERRIGKVTKIKTYVLRGYNLVFNVNECYANIVAGNENVEGVLYQVDDHQIDRLDLYEGSPLIYQKRYFITDEGQICYLYLAEDPRSYTSKPQWTYLQHLIKGAKENNLTNTSEKLIQLKKELKITKPRGSNAIDFTRRITSHGISGGRM